MIKVFTANMRRTIPITLVLLLLIIPFLSSIFLKKTACVFQVTETFDYQKIVSEINLDNIREHVSYFSSLGSLVPGYLGQIEASKYIHDKFREYGLLNVSFNEFNITVPIDYGAYLTILSPKSLEGTSLRLYMFWPNVIALGKTPPEGVTGRLVYVGDGSLKNMHGKPINGSIVLMDVNSQYNWFNAVKLGAKAIIFIQSQTTRQELAMKVLTVPFNFPRLLISEDDAKLLLNLLEEKGDLIVRLNADMRWEVRKVRNVIGYIKGTSNPDNIFLITSRYDSFSYIPALNPGAQDSISPAILLEMARFFSNNPPKYSIMFIAFAGTYFNLAGSRHFVKEYMVERYGEFGKNVVMVLNFDINAYTKNLAITSYQGDEGDMPGYVDITGFVRFEAQVHRNIEKVLGKSFSVDKSSMLLKMATVAGEGYGSNMGAFFSPLDHGAFLRISVPSLSWVTAHSMRLNWGTWQDTIEKIKFENLRDQLEFLFSSFYTFVNTEGIFPNIISPWTPTYGKIGQWVDARIRIVEYREGWYQPVPHALLAFKLENWFNRLTNPVYTVYVADENGNVEIYGISQGALARLEGYLLDPVTGNIIYGPDRGKYAFRSPEERSPGLFSFGLRRFIDLGYLTIFKCGSVVLFDIEDPYTSNVPLIPTTLFVNDMRTHGPPDHYSHVGQSDHSGNSILIIFSQPKTPIEVMLNVGRMPLILIKDLSVDDYGEQKTVYFPAFKCASQMHELNEHRIRDLLQSGLPLTSILEKHNKAYVILNEAKKLLEEMNYAGSYTKTMEALGLVRENYVNIRLSIESSAYTAPFFSLLLVPFAFILERLIFEKRGLKRLVILVAIFSVSAVALFLMYPGFRLTTDPLMVTLSSIIIILSLPILGIIISGFFDLIKGLRKKIVGEHYLKTEISKSFIMSLDTSIRYLKRRKMRTILIFLSLILVLSTIVPLISFSMSPIVKATVLREGAAPYSGIMMKYEKWGAVGGDPYRTGLSLKVIEQIKVMLEENGIDAVIAPRAWRVHEGLLYGLYAQDITVRAIILFANSHKYNVYGILALTPQESEVTGIDRYIVMGRWFTTADKYACIISENIASKLGITKLPATISLWDINLTLVGIISDDFEYFIDLDGEKMTPLEFRVPNPSYDVHIPVKETIIIPFDLALSLSICGWRGLETSIKSVAIKVRDLTKIEQVAYALFERFRLPIYFTVNGKVLYLSKGSIYSPIGLEQKIIPLLLAYLTFLNILLASIYERKRDIETFALVGLNPLEVSLVFLYEAICVALVGGILGFIGSCILMHLGSLLLPLPIQQLDYTTVVNMIILGMMITISSSIYPAIKASKMVTPSAERKWKPTTSPVNDRWEIPLPFVFEKDEEVAGILAFTYEAVKDHTTEQSELFFAKNFCFDIKSDLEWVEKSLIIEEASISPYDLGIKTDVSLIAKKDLKTMKYTFTILLLRKAGKMTDWIVFSPRVADFLRKQILLWRGLSAEEKRKYISQGVMLLSSRQVRENNVPP